MGRLRTRRLLCACGPHRTLTPSRWGSSRMPPAPPSNRTPSAADSPVARLFLALWPDERTRTRLGERAAFVQWSSTARRTPTGNLHLTLHFIGNVPTRSVGGLADALFVPSK